MMTHAVRLKLLLACLMLVAAIWLAGCGGAQGERGTGLLTVAITDQGSDYARVVVGIRAVRVVPAGLEDSGNAGLPVVATFNPPLSVDVLTLNGVEQVLGQNVVPTGEYTQVRLVLAQNDGQLFNYVTLQSDPNTRLPLVTPSGQESGLKIPGHFTVAEAFASNIVLDFDPQRAIVITGTPEYLLKPTGIRVVQVDGNLAEHGTIFGTISPPGAWSTGTVSAVRQGQTDPVATGDVNPDDGSFRLFVPAGTYYLVAGAEGFQTLSTPPAFVTVALGQEKTLGNLPLTPSP